VTVTHTDVQRGPAGSTCGKRFALRSGSAFLAYERHINDAGADTYIWHGGLRGKGVRGRDEVPVYVNIQLLYRVIIAFAPAVGYIEWERFLIKMSDDEGVDAGLEAFEIPTKGVNSGARCTQLFLVKASPGRSFGNAGSN
jgi:hypothetical protein